MLSDIDIFEISNLVVFHSITTGTVIAVLLTAFLLLMSGFASGSEIAFFSLSPQDLDELEPDKNSYDEKIQQLRNDSERTLATILITILLLQYIKRIAKHPWCLSNLTASLRLNTFTKIDLFQWINEPFSPPPDEPEIA